MFGNIMAEAHPLECAPQPTWDCGELERDFLVLAYLDLNIFQSVSALLPHVALLRLDPAERFGGRVNLPLLRARQLHEVLEHQRRKDE